MTHTKGHRTTDPIESPKAVDWVSTVTENEHPEYVGTITELDPFELLSVIIVLDNDTEYQEL